MRGPSRSRRHDLRRSRHVLRRSEQQRCTNLPPHNLTLTGPHASRLTFSSRPSCTGKRASVGKLKGCNSCETTIRPLSCSDCRRGPIMSRSTQETSPVAGAPSGARARLAALGLTLHGPHPPHPPLLAVVTHNGVAYVSGQLPRI